MKKKIINGILAAAILVAVPSAFVSCKDNDADLRTELLGKIADLRNQLDQIVLKAGPEGKPGQDGKDGKDGSVVTIGNNGNWFIDGVDTGVPSQIKGDVGAAGKDGHTPEITIGDNGNWFIDGKDTGKTAIGKDGKDGKDGNDGTIGSIVTIGPNGNWFINDKDTGIPATGPKGDKGNDGKDATLPSVISIGENGNWFIDGVDTLVPATGPAGADGEDGITPVLVKGDDGHHYWWIKGVYTGVRADGIDGTGPGGDIWTISEGGTWVVNGIDTYILAYDYDQMVKLIKDQIYNAERDGLTPELEDQIKKLLNNLENALQKSVKEMVTDVVAERTENAVYGQLAIPGWNPLVLAAYYGETGADVTFPDPAIDIKGKAIDLMAGETIMSDGGKIIFTLNPAEVNITGKEITLETSQGKASPFELKDVQPYDGEITYGWNRTRAGSNGLYEATAELKKASAAGINVDVDVLKKDAEEVLNDLRLGHERNAVKSLANFMADAFTDAIETIPAYTVKVSWTDGIFGPRSVRSGYDIAAFSLKPLAYDFEYGLNADVKPYIDRIQLFFDKVVQKAYLIYKDEIEPGDFTNIRIESFKEWLTKEEITISYKGKLRTIKLSDQPADIKKLVSNIKNAYDDVEQLNKDIQNINYLKSIGVEKAKNQLKAEIHDYLGELTYRINSFIKDLSINEALQPTLLIKDSKGMHRATGSFSGELSLVPTSYTAEILAPAYKKFIVITEVDGAAATAADNPGQLGEVLEGDVQQIKFTPEAGKTYTIAYSAMDYFGNVVTNYYVISGK